MAAAMYRVYAQRRQRQVIRRNRIFRDRTHPFEVFDDTKIFKKYRFRRADILDITREVEGDIRLCNRKGSLTPLLQVMVTLRYYASASFQDICGEMIGASQPTVSRAVSRVTDALLRQVPQYVRLPDDEEVRASRRKFYQRNGFPNVCGCIDGTQVRIIAPAEQEHEYVNRKGYHSINVQVVCDADLIFVNCVAKWPGSVHDSRILRQSGLFAAFENNWPNPMRGVILGDSGYMVRDWLFTPLLNPTTAKEIAYSNAHRSARSTVERAIGVLKKRWHSLRRLRIAPNKACKVITVCVMLHNRARTLKLEVPSDSESDSATDSSSSESESESDDDYRPANYQISERVRTAAGKIARQRLINTYF